jgi:SAM-dependent methyltransferase
MALPDDVFTGNWRNRAAFFPDLDSAIEYDSYEAHTPMIEQNERGSRLTTNYRHVARLLVSHFPAALGDRVLDLGSGTGISTLELLCQHPSLSVVGVEMAKGPYKLAKFKFHKIAGRRFRHEKDPALQAYWDAFRKESERFSDQIRFVNRDFLDDKISTSRMFRQKFDGAIGNQFVHNTYEYQCFKQLKEVLKPGAHFVWNTASHYCYDGKIPPAEHSFRYNEFLKYVLDEVNKTMQTKDMCEQPKTHYSIGWIKRMTWEFGFATSHLATYLIPVDMQTFIHYHVPPIVRGLMKEKHEDADSIIQNAIGEAIKNPFAMSDTRHKYEIIPVFSSTYVKD